MSETNRDRTDPNVPQAVAADPSAEQQEIARVNSFPDVPPDGGPIPDDDDDMVVVPAAGPLSADPAATATLGGWSPAALVLGLGALLIIVLAMVFILQGVFLTMPK